MTQDHNRRATDLDPICVVDSTTITDCIRVEGKLDRLEETVAVLHSKLTEEHSIEHEYIKRALEREARKERLHMAIIEKTMTALFWSFLVGLGSLLWTTMKDHWK